MLLSTINKWYF